MLSRWLIGTYRYKRLQRLFKHLLSLQKLPLPVDNTMVSYKNSVMLFLFMGVASHVLSKPTESEYSFPFYVFNNNKNKIPRFAVLTNCILACRWYYRGAWNRIHCMGLGELPVHLVEL